MSVLLGFKAVELGAEVLDECTKEQLAKVKEESNVEVVGMCAPKG